MSGVAGLLLAVLTAATVWAAATGWRGSLREGLAVAIGVLLAWVAVSSEALSAMGALSRGWIAVAWLLLAALAAPIGWRARRTVVDRWADIRGGVPRREAFAGLVLLGASLLVVGAAAPNNWDSMTYHLARVAHWGAQRDLGFWSTVNDRQLWTPPLAEYAVLHLVQLTGSDRAGPLVQWAAYAACGALASLVAARLGLGPRLQGAAALLVLTAPIAVAEATTTQNDLVSACLALAITACALRPRAASLSAALVGEALPLALLGADALLVKPTALLVSAPFLVLWLIRHAGRSPARVLGAALVGLVATVAVVGPFFARNLSAFDDPLGPPDRGGVTVASPTPATTVENLIRLVGVNLGTPVGSLNDRSGDAIRAAMRRVGLDPDDPRATLPAQRFSVPFDFQEDVTGNLAFVCCLVVAVVLVLSRRRLRVAGGSYLMCVGLGLLLFCAVLSWQPWITRLSLPLLAVAAPLVALAMSALSVRMARTLVVLLVVGAVPWALHSRLRPLVSPDSVLVTGDAQEYFAGRPTLRAPYEAVLAQVRARHVDRLGLVQGGDDYEYPWWALQPGGAVGRPDALPVDVTRTPPAAWSSSGLQAVACSAACTAPPGWTTTTYGSLRLLLRQ